MRYTRLTENDLSNLNRLGVYKLFAEVLADGKVTREVGLDQSGNIVHRFPGKGKFGKYGILDNALLNLGDKGDDISPTDFENLYRID